MINQKIQAQLDLCKKTGVEMFAMENGICCWCDKPIFDSLSLEECSTNLITGCPNCNRSFVE